MPGPNTVLILAHSIGGGRRAGLATVAGVELGTLAHTAAAALGLSALLSRSALAFEVVRLVGASVLVILGALELLREGEPTSAAAPVLSVRRAFVRALVGNLLNPKVAIFFLAFLPQWVDPAHGTMVAQVLVLGAIVSAIGWLSGSMLALTAGAFAAELGRRDRFQRWRRRVGGFALTGLGLWMAMAHED